VICSVIAFAKIKSTFITALKVPRCLSENNTRQGTGYTSVLIHIFSSIKDPLHCQSTDPKYYADLHPQADESAVHTSGFHVSVVADDWILMTESEETLCDKIVKWK